MPQKKRAKKNPINISPRMMLAAAGVVLVLLILLVGGRRKNAVDPLELQAGINFLEQQAQKNPDTVRQTRQALNKRRLEQQRDELMAKLESGEIDPFTVLQDFVVMGDSRTMGFNFYGFLPEEQVLADNGYKITNIPEWHDELKKQQPQYVFLCYGVNDCAVQHWANGREHSAEYMEYIRELQKMLPNTTFVVSSILPVQDFAIEDYPNWAYLPDWNEALKAACKEAGILFADCDYLYDAYPQFWEGDGFHFTRDLYPYWTSRLAITALYGDLLEEN